MTKESFKESDGPEKLNLLETLVQLLKEHKNNIVHISHRIISIPQLIRREIPKFEPRNVTLYDSEDDEFDDLRFRYYKHELLVYKPYERKTGKLDNFGIHTANISGVYIISEDHALIITIFCEKTKINPYMPDYKGNFLTCSCFVFEYGRKLKDINELKTIPMLSIFLNQIIYYDKSYINMLMEGDFFPDETARVGHNKYKYKNTEINVTEIIDDIIEKYNFLKFLTPKTPTKDYQDFQDSDYYYDFF